MDPSKNVANAFAVVDKIYQESALLCKEVQAQIQDQGFKKLIPENKINTTNSNNLNNAQEWITRYGAFHFIQKNCDAKKEKNRLYFAIHFVSSKYNSEPVVLAGIARKKDTKIAEYSPKWAQWVFGVEPEYVQHYRLSTGGRFQIKDSLDQPPLDGTLMYSQCLLDDESYRWPKDAIHFAEPLLKFDSIEKVSAMVSELVHIWENKEKLPEFYKKAVSLVK